MEDAFRIAAVWLSLAVAASVLAYHLRISMALVEICVGVAAGFVVERYFGAGALGAGIDWSGSSQPPAPSSLRSWPGPSSSPPSCGPSGRR
jgi:hypothetical protein